VAGPARPRLRPATLAVPAPVRGVDPGGRAAVTSSFFVVLYAAISLPVVGVGAASQAWGLVLQRRVARVPA
jgi:hypothetical protein